MLAAIAIALGKGRRRVNAPDIDVATRSSDAGR